MKFFQFRGWLSLIIHLGLFILLLSMQMTDKSFHGDSHAYWTIALQLLQKNFPSAIAKMLALFLILAPTWAIFITRKMTFFGNFILLIAIIWSACIGLFFYQKITIEPWLYWFLYAAIMLILGLIGILIRVIFSEEKQQTFYENSEE